MGGAPEFTGVCIMTGDVRRLTAFYRDVLGLDIRGDARHASLAAEGPTLAIFSGEGMEEMAPGSMAGAHYGGWTLAFRVADVDAEWERLVTRGVSAVKPPETYPWGRRSAWLRDPDGNIVTLYQVVD